jgi:hypothetical protein
MIIHVIAKGNYFNAYGDALAEAFKTAGHEVIRFNEDIYEVPKVEADIHVVVGPNVYNHDTIRELPGKKVAILTEQMPQLGYPASHFVIDRLQQFTRHKDLYDLYIEWSEMNGEFLKAKFPDLNLAVFPHGFVDSDVLHVPTTSCDWDVCFFGSLSGRRQDLLDELKKNSSLRIFPEHEDVWGKYKYEVMRSSIVILNMHFADFPPSFEAHRLFDAISVGRPVVSEKMNGVPPGILNNGLHAAQFLYDDLVDGLMGVLTREPATLDAMGSSLRFAAEHKYPMETLTRIILQHTNKPAKELEVYY